MCALLHSDITPDCIDESLQNKELVEIIGFLPTGVKFTRYVSVHWSSTSTYSLEQGLSLSLGFSSQCSFEDIAKKFGWVTASWTII